MFFGLPKSPRVPRFARNKLPMGSLGRVEFPVLRQPMGKIAKCRNYLARPIVSPALAQKGIEHGPREQGAASGFS
jgi:hypothetical protein